MRHINCFAAGILKGKVALITGAGHGIGQGIATLLAELGAVVVVNDINAESAQQAVATINENGWDATAAVADVTSKEEVADLVAKVIDGKGSLDILVANAGSTLGEQEFARFESEDLELIERIARLNLMAAIYCSRAAARHMVQRKTGCIINISSSVALSGDAKFIAYSAAKGGVISFTRSLARAMAMHGIRVNCIVPGTINSGNRSQEYLAKQIQRVPMRRAGNSEDVAQAVAFLVSDAAGFITGQVLAVNGGQTMQ